MSKVNAGFRCDEALYEEVKSIATKEQRSISTVLATMVATGVAKYNQSGWQELPVQEEINE